MFPLKAILPPGHRKISGLQGGGLPAQMFQVCGSRGTGQVCERHISHERASQERNRFAIGKPPTQITQVLGSQ